MQTLSTPSPLQPHWMRLVLSREGQLLLEEFEALQEAGRSAVPTAGAGREAWDGGIDNLFRVLRQLVREDAQRRQLEDWSVAAENVEGELMAMLRALDEGERFCNDHVETTVTATLLLRKRLRDLQVRTPEAFVAEADRFLGLLAPDVSLRQVYDRNQDSCARLWEALGRILKPLQQQDGFIPPVAEPLG